MLPGAVDAAGHDISQTVDFGHSKASGRETVGRSYIYIQSPAAAGVLQRWNLQAGIRLVRGRIAAEPFWVLPSSHLSPVVSVASHGQPTTSD
ncbi:hypothetical protein V8C44DRAFT_193271 [Trichoderma aethiopicum]